MSGRPTLAEVEAALERGEIVVWRQPDGSVELLAERDADPRVACVNLVVLGEPEPPENSSYGASCDTSCDTTPTNARELA